MIGGKSMNKFSGIIQSIRTATTRHGPEILTGVGIAGMITTTIMAVKATPKALMLIEEEKRHKNRELESTTNGDKCKQITQLKPLELVKTTWKCYLPAGITGILSIACVVGGQKESVRRSTAFATAYSISENALKTYQQKVVETIGEKKEILVRDAVAKEEVEKNPVNTREVIITEKGNTLCFDIISQRYFKSDMDTLKRTENELNRQLRSDMFISLNEFYSQIGLSSSSIGDDIGWTVDDGFEISFSSQIAEDGTPCLVISYPIEPKYDR